MRRSRLLVLVLSAATVAASCAVSDWTIDVVAPESPTPPPTPPFDVGDGADGPFVQASGTFTPNLCRVLSATTGDLIGVASSSGFSAGDRVLVWQVEDSFGTSGNQTAITDPARAGLWEMATVESVGAGKLVLTSALEHAYSTEAQASPAYRAQVCRVPRYTDVTLSGDATLQAVPYNGTEGGIVAFFASGTVTLSGTAATVNVAGLGARIGGGSFTNDNACGAPPNDGGPFGFKGEGLDATSPALTGPKNLANAGGGGGGTKGGGGGGGNGGKGGRGGLESSTCLVPDPSSSGLGGAALSLPILSRVSFGGGGGGGLADTTAEEASTGQNGGGVILVFARDLAGNGTLSADGISVVPLSSEAGAGGGAAGGTVIVRAFTSSFTGTIRARGGDGGSVQDPGVERCGPGGGGGGGRIRVTALVASSATIVLDGGEPGQNVNAQDKHGAEAGEGGILEIE